jgi:uncharacterized membrane protein YgcG
VGVRGMRLCTFRPRGQRRPLPGRLLTAFLAALLVGVLGALPAPAVEPFALPDQITDQVGAVDGRTGEVRAALDDVYAQHGIRLWVVFVDTFDGADPQRWASDAFAATGLGADDYLLAVAMKDRLYGYVVDTGFVLDDAALARVAKAAERHLAENPPRAVVEAAGAIHGEITGLSSDSTPLTGDVDGSTILLVVVGVMVVVVSAGAIVAFATVVAAHKYRDGPGPGYGPPATPSDTSSWWADSSGWDSSGSSSGSSSGGWSDDGGGSSDTRGGSGSF